MVKQNLLAAYAGAFWSVLLPLVVTPFVLKSLGREAYGLIGVGLMLQSILSLMEVGLSSSLSRAFAERTSKLDDVSKSAGMHDLLRTLEYFYIAMALMAFLLITLISPLIANHWLTGHTLSYSVIWQSLSLIGLMTGIRFLISLYAGGLAGLQHQVLLNKITILLNTISSFGAVAVLVFIKPDPRLYFLWLSIMGMVIALSLRLALNHALPTKQAPAKFDKSQWRSVRQFALGMNALTFTSLAVTQTDKLLLSRLIPLRDFGFYSIAANVANFVQFPIAPVHAVFYPKLTLL